MSFPNLGTIGDAIGAIGFALTNSRMGAGSKALGNVLTDIGRGASGVGSASDAGSGGVVDEALNIASQMLASEAAVGAAVAVLTTYPEAALCRSRRDRSGIRKRKRVWQSFREEAKMAKGRSNIVAYGIVMIILGFLIELVAMVLSKNGFNMLSELLGWIGVFVVCLATVIAYYVKIRL